MTEPSIQTADVRPKRGISAIWLLPVLAVAIAAWLMYKNVGERGMTVTVAFDNGSGISVGKTPVMYQGINVGEVVHLQLDDDLDGVTATLELNQQIAPLIRSETNFWLVKPQISLSGVSGLDTLVAGNYISFNPGDGEPANHFKALLEPPPLASNSPGLRLELRADNLGSLTVGAPILYQQIDVGDLEGYQLTQDGVKLIVRIDPPYTHLVNESSRFWLQSGIQIDAGLQGVKIEAGSVASILAGGITFDTPKKSASKVDDNSRFKLFESREKAQGSKIVTVFFQNPDGLNVGSKVRLLGRDVGTVEALNFVDNRPDQGAMLNLELKSPHHQYLNESSKFWLVKPEVSSSGVTGLDALISGPYIAMQVSGQGGELPEFYEALSAAPDTRIKHPGLRLTLRSDELSSINVGSKIYYRKIAVGQVEAVDLDNDGVSIGIFIHERYAKLVRRESLFWNASGINISGGLGGIDIQADSLATIVAGGIAFYNPEVKNPQLAWEGLRYTLHANYESTLSKKGRNISLYFASGSGIAKGTEIKYQGIKVGEVTAVEIDGDMRGVNVSAHLTPSAKGLARQGSQFWLVKPELGLVGTRNLETLVTGSYISVRPGTGDIQREFIALNRAPALQKPDTGLNLVLTTPQRGSIKPGLKVSYRDIPVGEVFGFELSADATHTLIHINIEPRYAALVSSDSKFWNASGIDINFGLFSGAKIRSKSVESLLEGGISFATPDKRKASNSTLENAVFKLHDSVDPDWLSWKPSIVLHKDSTGTQVSHAP